MSVGDVSSTARGTGARFNDGKPPLELIPLRILAAAWWRETFTAPQKRAHDALVALAMYQEGAGPEALYAALVALGSPFHEAAAVLDYGKRKYAPFNWAKGMPWSVCIGCAARHVEHILWGDELDAESGLPHVGHLACNLIFLIQYASTYREGDDRPRGLL